MAMAPILLDANENPVGCTVGPEAALGVHLNRYPDPNQVQLKSAIAGLRGCRPSQLFIGVGSDEVIDLLIRATCTPGRDAILVCSPTYAMYQIFGEINDVATIDVPLSPLDYQLRVPQIVAALTPRVKLLFLCSPGNPTSRLLRRADIEAVAAASTGALVVVDEAYIDYADQTDSCAGLVGQLPNVVVMQTFSKAWGLAGARVGVAIAPERLVSVVDRVKAPFNLSTLSEQATLRAISAAPTVRSQRDALLQERARVAAALAGPAFAHAVQRVVPSDANFVLVQMSRCKEVCEELGRVDHIVLRYRGGMLHCEDCVRISIGTEEENGRVLAALARALGQPVRAVEG